MEKSVNDATVLARSEDLLGTTVGRFQITALLGKGGMGEVYLAEDSLLKRSVALKRVSASLRYDPQYRELLIKEAERASRLNDERVAHVHDVLEDKGEVFLVMEYVEGKSLRETIGEPMPLKQFLHIATQCAEGLVAAHQNGIIHRDIKPENIMITTKGRVKICDFGLAKHVSWKQESTMLLEGKSPVTLGGTPAYMAPEALLNRSPDFRADMFSLGVVFYELLTGTHPFREENNLMATADRTIHSVLVPAAQLNPSIPQKLSDIVDRMLRKQPSERYASPEDLLQELEAIKSPAPVARRSLNRRQALAGIFLLALFASVFALTRLDGNRTGGKPPRQRNMVVLPFRSIDGTSEGQIYSDGLTETVTARLSSSSETPDLQVAPSSEVRARKVITAEEARKQFSADLVLSGTLQQSGAGERLVYSLYDAASLRQLRTDTIATDSPNSFALEDRLIHDVLNALEVPAKSTTPQDEAKAHTSVAAAYDLYVQGRGYLRDGSDGSLQTAVRSLQRATELDPGYASAYAALGEAYWKKYETTQEPVWVASARRACEKATSLDSRSAEARICLGTVNLGNGQYERAVMDFESALDTDPTNDAAYRLLANVHEKVGDFAAAESTLRRAIRLKPNYYLGHKQLGEFYMHRARYQDAAAEFQTEITLIPNGDEAYLRIGAVYIYLGRYDDAITVLRQSIELRPTPGAYSNLGSTYLRLRRYDDAIPVFEQAAQLFPRKSIFTGNLARAYYWSSDRRAQAVATYNRAVALASEELRVNPRDSDALIMLARYYAMLGRKPEAIENLDKALKLRPAVAEYFSIAAVVYTQFGDSASALSALRKARSLGWSQAEIKSEIEFDKLRENPDFKKITES